MSQEERRRYARRQASLRKWGKIAVIAMGVVAIAMSGLMLYLAY